MTPTKKKKLGLKKMIRLARQLMIVNQVTSSQGTWDINEEQIEILRAVILNQACILLKGRQVGSSTVCLLYILVLAITNPGMPYVVIADTADKAKAMLERITGWCDQLGITLIERAKGGIVLENGASIDALSAVSRAEGGESRVGRSKSYAGIVMSELAFYMNDEAVFRGLTATALPGARMVIESTASAADNLFRSLWNSENEWQKIFLSTERHETYRRNAKDITDEKWAELQDPKYGFTNRESASWWWNTCVNKFNSDEIGCLREFPIIPAHCFANAKGRWINVYTEAAVREEGEWEKGRFSGWMRYKPGKPTEPVVFGVDTAAGHGGDSSALCILGLYTGTIYATWCSSTTAIPEYIELVKACAEKWKPKAIIVEFNGIGIPVYEALSQMTKHNVIKQVSGVEKHLRLQRLKAAIEDGTVPIGPELIYEAKNSRIKPPKSAKSQAEYVGRDDMLNAVSFAREFYLTKEPSSVEVDMVAKLNPETHFHRDFIKEKKKNRKY